MRSVTYTRSRVLPGEAAGFQRAAVVSGKTGYEKDGYTGLRCLIWWYQYRFMLSSVRSCFQNLLGYFVFSALDCLFFFFMFLRASKVRQELWSWCANWCSRHTPWLFFPDRGFCNYLKSFSACCAVNQSLAGNASMCSGQINVFASENDFDIQRSAR